VAIPDPDEPTAAARIVEAMHARQPALVERVLHRIQGEITFYGSTDVISREETREALRSNLAYIIRNLPGSTDLDLHAPEETGRRRAAQGVPLVDLIAAYRLAFSEIWAEAVTVTQVMAGVGADDLAAMAGRLFELHEQYTGAAVAGYREKARELLRIAERERSVWSRSFSADRRPPASCGRRPSRWGCRSPARSWWWRRPPPNPARIRSPASNPRSLPWMSARCGGWRRRRCSACWPPSPTRALLGGECRRAGA
jgi:hypothetical protein